MDSRSRIGRLRPNFYREEISVVLRANNVVLCEEVVEPGPDQKPAYVNPMGLYLLYTDGSSEETIKLPCYLVVGVCSDGPAPAIGDYAAELFVFDPDGRSDLLATFTSEWPEGDAKPISYIQLDLRQIPIHIRARGVYEFRLHIGGDELARLALPIIDA
jgi:hypothetical protein